MMMLVSGMTRACASSSSTGILAIGQSAANAARASGSPRSTILGVEGRAVLVERDQHLPAEGGQAGDNGRPGSSGAPPSAVRRPARARLGHVAPGGVEMAIAAIIRIGDRLPLPGPAHGRAAATAAPGFPPAGSLRGRRDCPRRARRSWSKRSKSSGGHLPRALSCEMSTPLRRAAAIARRSGGSPACQSPVPGRIRLGVEPEPLRLRAERRLGERRAADIAEADEQDP